MRFSERTNWNTEESELARAHRLRAAAGLPIADLTASNPTRCGFALSIPICSRRWPIRALSTTIRSRAACCTRARRSAPTMRITAWL